MRRAGILMHITSLHGPYPIGTMGKEAFQFIEFLSKSGQKLWQILPICPIGAGNSPYQSNSTFAINSLLIDYRILAEDGLLTEEECKAVESEGKDKADYEQAKLLHKNLMQIAYKRFIDGEKSEKYQIFLENEKSWLNEYCLFMALKEYHHNLVWNEWEEWAKRRNNTAIEQFMLAHTQEIGFYSFVQYICYNQWSSLKEYANSKNIKIIGDLPIYVSYDSADVWSNQDLFWLDDQMKPVEVAGCPPDCFSPTGQLWGNPLYRWDSMKNNLYDWWTQRFLHSKILFDLVRIDHFRGLESYYAIPNGDVNALNGHWLEGPGSDFFVMIKEKTNIDVIAEDLGMITDDVKKMLRDSGFPGMKVLQFAFEACGGSDYLPHNHIKNCVVYTGTHDNDTLKGYCDHLSDREKNFIKEYLFIEKDEDLPEALIRCCYQSVADTVILPIQDYLNSPSEQRMNTPSTVEGNWLFRIHKCVLTEALAQRINKLTTLYER